LEQVDIAPLVKPISATVEMPGSKSITNRAMLIAAIAQGRSVIEGALLSDDTRYMAAALRMLGFIVEIDETEHRITVGGQGGRIPVRGGVDLDVGGAGTVMRFLVAMLTLGEGRYRIDGNQRMRQRPIGPLLDAMERLGASVYAERDDNCPPVIVDASRARFQGGQTSIDARVSSQFVSAMLMPAALWPLGIKLNVVGEVARPFIDMTLRVMESWGVTSTVSNEEIAVAGGQWYRAQRYSVEPDASSASYFAAAAALVGGRVRIPGLKRDSVQGDIGFLGLLEKMGATVTWLDSVVEIEGGSTLSGIDIEMNSMPDLVATLAAIAPFASSPTKIRGVAFIRYHESDRLQALACELNRLGATVRLMEDGLEIEPSTIHGAEIETYDDHRIAMAFALTGLKQNGVVIKNPGCVTKTFPDFFEKLATLSA
jgi:3-phosphoshikimate 1-carboxyvinyltransferase